MANVPGNTSSTVRLPLGTTIDGLHERDDDTDWYRVRLEGGTNYTFRASVFAPGGPDEEDAFAFASLSLLNARGEFVAVNSSIDDAGDAYDAIGGFD